MIPVDQNKKTREVLVTRIFDAPVELVWKCWTEPEYVKKWWGPKDFTAPTIKMDFWVGGKYLYSMRGMGLDGVVRDSWNIGEYFEIIPREKIVASMKFADEHGDPVPASYYGLPGEWPDQVMLTVTFEKVAGDKTQVTVQEVGIPVEMSKFAQLGWEQSLDKFAESLQ